MMTRSRVVPTLLVLLVTVLSQPSQAQQSAVADSIRSNADRFIAALASHDIDKFVALFAEEPDFIYVDAGRIYPDRAALRKAGANFVGSIRTFNAKWDPVKILVTGPDAGVFTGVMTVQGTNSAGNAIWPNGKIWTLAYQRRQGQWKIVQAHEANVPAPRPAQ
jgi:ketosteroid isomerase-like protein